MISYKKKAGQLTDMWRLNNMLSNKWVNEEIKWEIKKCLEANEMEIYPNLQNAAKAVVREKLIEINAYLKK